MTDDFNKGQMSGAKRVLDYLEENCDTVIVEEKSGILVTNKDLEDAEKLIW